MERRQIEGCKVIASGGYDLDPFAALARAGILRSALLVDEHTPRLANAERASLPDGRGTTTR